MNNHKIVLLFQRGCLTCNPNKELQIKMQTVYHLELLQRKFASREFDENFIENLDETHFVVNLDNGQILGFQGDTIVKYGEGIWW